MRIVWRLDLLDRRSWGPHLRNSQLENLGHIWVTPINYVGVGLGHQLDWRNIALPVFHHMIAGIFFESPILLNIRINKSINLHYFATQFFKNIVKFVNDI